MSTGKHIFTGTAGLYYVMHRLAAEGIHAACTHGNAPHIDILASAADGSLTLAIQVKTTEHALRLKGRGEAKQPHRVEFPLGRSSAKLSQERVFFAFVDLRVHDGPEIAPDVYIYPSTVVAAHCASWVDQVPLVRFHTLVAAAALYKNRWDILDRFLNGIPPDDEDLKHVRRRDVAGNYRWHVVPLTERGRAMAVSYAGDASTPKGM